MHNGQELPLIRSVLLLHFFGFITNSFGGIQLQATINEFTNNTVSYRRNRNLCVSNICSTGTFGLSCSEKSSIRVTEVRLEPTSTSIEIVRGNLQTLCNGRKYCAADGLRTLIPHCQLVLTGGIIPVVAVYYSCQTGLMQIQQHILRQPVKNIKQGEATCGITPGQEQAITTLSRFEDNGPKNSNTAVDPRGTNKKLKAVVSYVFLTVAVLAILIAISFIIGSYIKYYQAGQYHIESSERALLRKEDTPMGSFPRGDDELNTIIHKTDTINSNSRHKGTDDFKCKSADGPAKDTSSCKGTLRNGGITTFSPSTTPTRSVSGLYSAVAMETPRKSWASVGPASLDLEEDDDAQVSGSIQLHIPKRQSSEKHRVFSDRFSDSVEHYLVNNDEYAVVRKPVRGSTNGATEEIYATPLDNMELRNQFQVTTGPYYAKRQTNPRPTLAFTDTSKNSKWEDEYF
ncbi:uncharacterized protein LOC115211097 isoform X2 [Octopus sinensis]|uniref:Uncharacterized protein LOC115211097 isoform X2 n=1 Tax=Octopus sinensis TaxID=2607531 RepID=A0A7E6ESR8_9MOLL|nr:uncharacterized protein LOC115211097 isoform X2 [Octopus sinensis]